MALTGNGTSDYVKTSSAVSAIARPSFHFFYRNAAAPGSASIQKPFSLADASGNYYFVFSWDHTAVGANQAITLRDSGGTYTDCQFVTVLTNDTWYGIGGSYDGTNINAYLDGVSDATAAASALTTGTNPTISVLAGQAGGAEFDDGTIAEVGVWNVALSAADFAALGQGVSPLLVRPDALVFYTPLIRSIVGLKGNAITSSGGTVADHCRMYYADQPHLWPATDAITMTFSKSISHTLTLAQGSNQTDLASGIDFAGAATLQDLNKNLSQGIAFNSRLVANTGYLASGRHRLRPDG